MSGKSKNVQNISREQLERVQQNLRHLRSLQSDLEDQLHKNQKVHINLQRVSMNINEMINQAITNITPASSARTTTKKGKKTGTGSIKKKTPSSRKTGIYGGAEDNQGLTGLPTDSFLTEQFYDNERSNIQQWTDILQQSLHQMNQVDQELEANMQKSKQIHSTFQHIAPQLKTILAQITRDTETSNAEPLFDDEIDLESQETKQNLGILKNQQNLESELGSLQDQTAKDTALKRNEKVALDFRIKNDKAKIEQHIKNLQEMQARQEALESSQAWKPPQSQPSQQKK